MLFCNLKLIVSKPTARHYLFFKYLFTLKLCTSGKLETKWLPSTLDVEFEAHYSATSNEETHAELDRTDHTVSEVIMWKWCILWPQKSCKRCWTSFTLSTCKTDHKYGYKLLKIICNSNEFTDFERRTEKCRIALRLLPFNNKTEWDGLMTAHFELGKCRKM